MRELLSAAGRAFLRAFGAAIITLSFGILAAPNLNASYGLGVAALFAAFAAGLRALQAYVPSLSVEAHVPYGAFIDAFLQGFVGSVVVTLPGILDSPDLHLSKSIVVGVVTGAITAGLRAVQGLLTRGEHPSPTVGVETPVNARPVSPAPPA